MFHSRENARQDFLIAVRDAQKTGHLIDQQTGPKPCDNDQENDPDQEKDRIRKNAVSSSHISYDGHHGEEEKHWQEPHHDK